jgi:hypothetical protein
MDRVRIFGAVVDPPPHFRVIAATWIFQRSAIGAQTIRDGRFWPTVPSRQFLEDSGGCLAILRFGHKACKHRPLVVNGSALGLTPLILA